ncbi:MAG: ATP-dependent Clp protease proteolytic subunit [Planctomycetota bacterium]|jgi:ATP-dependent protease ClpP protease subunit
MKIFKTVILTAIILLLGCTGNMGNVPVRHALDLNVKSGDPVIIETGSTSRHMEVNNPYLELSMVTSISESSNIAIMKIFSGLSVSDYTRMLNDFLYLYHETDIRDVHIYISSPGGDAFTGMALSDTIITFQGLGFRVTGHASGIVASAAVPVFSVCETRLAAPGTLFMVHEAAMYKWPGRETASDIRSQNELMRVLQDRYIGYLPKVAVSAERWIELIKMTTWFDTGKAMEWGIVQATE